MSLFRVDFSSNPTQTQAGVWVFSLASPTRVLAVRKVDNLVDAWQEVCQTGPGVVARQVVTGLQNLKASLPRPIEVTLTAQALQQVQGGAAQALPQPGRRKRTEVSPPLPERTETPLEELLHDQSLLQSDSQVFCLFDGNTSPARTMNHLAAEAIFCQGLLLYLDELPVDDYRRARLYAAWQWYHLTRSLFVQARQTPGLKDEAFRKIRMSLAESYRKLYNLLADPANAASLLWLGKLAQPQWQARKQSEASLQEKALRSLFLTRPPEPEAGVYGRPQPAIGLAEDELNWQGVSLLPVFQEEQNQREVRRFIHSFLLPHYDFRTAMQLSARLAVKPASAEDENPGLQAASNKPFEWLLTNPWKVWGSAVFALLVSIGVGLLGRSLANGMQTATGTLLFINLLQVLTLTLLLILIFRWVGMNLAGYLSLPRLTGGVVVGYLAMILQDNPGALSDVIWRGEAWTGWVKVILVNLAILAIGFLYLYFDLRPVLQSQAGLAAHRSLLILALAVFISALLGMLFVALATVQPFVAERLYFLGPFGWVDWRHYAVYVPLALFTGLVTQFIFEDKPLTAPVWSPEQPN